MRGSLILSTLLHVAIIAIIWLGPFDFGDQIIDPVQVVDVEVVTEIKQRPDEETKPTPEEKPEKTPPPPKTASLPPPPPPTPPAPPAPPQPAAKPEPKEEPAPVPKKEPEAVPVPKKEAKPEPKPEEVAKPEPVFAPRPRRKPKPPPEDDFASVLKTVEKLKKRPRKPDSKPEKPKKDEPSFEDQLSSVLNKHARPEPPSQPAPLGPKMSMSEIDALRRQIERCWNPPAGAPEAENLVVEVKLTINRDGTVRRTQIVDTARMNRDPFYRAAAESVRRAIKSPLCTPLKLPLDKYELWKDTTLRFDPRELVGR